MARVSVVLFLQSGNVRQQFFFVETEKGVRNLRLTASEKNLLKRLSNSRKLEKGAPLQSKLRANSKNVDTTGFSTGQKGALGELRTAQTMRRAGFEELPAKLPSNQGFDGVWIKRGKDGGITDIVITESKFSSTGKLKLSNTATMGRQLSPQWIDANIQKMLNSVDPATVRTGMLLQANRHLVRAKAAVLNPDGIQRFIIP